MGVSKNKYQERCMYRSIMRLDAVGHAEFARLCGGRYWVIQEKRYI